MPEQIPVKYRKKIYATMHEAAEVAAKREKVNPTTMYNRFRKAIHDLGKDRDLTGIDLKDYAMGKPKTILVDGVHYPSVATAAEATGLARGVLYNRIRERGEGADLGGEVQSHKKPVTVNGQTFTSLSEAATHFGLPEQTLTNRLLAAGPGGTISTEKAAPRNHGEVTIDGTTYPNLAEAARTLGIARNTLLHRIRRSAQSE